MQLFIACANKLNPKLFKILDLLQCIACSGHWFKQGCSANKKGGERIRKHNHFLTASHSF